MPSRFKVLSDSEFWIFPLAYVTHAWDLESRDKKMEDLVPDGGSPSRKEFTATEKRYRRWVAKIPGIDTHRKQLSMTLKWKVIPFSGSTEGEQRLVSNHILTWNEAKSSIQGAIPEDKKILHSEVYWVN